MRYTLPALAEGNDVVEEVAGPSDWERRIEIPVNDSILEYCQVGEGCELTLTGKIVEARSSDSDEGPSRKSITLQVSDVQMPGDEEMFASGFNRTAKHY